MPVSRRLLCWFVSRHTFINTTLGLKQGLEQTTSRWKACAVSSFTTLWQDGTHKKANTAVTTRNAQNKVTRVNNCRKYLKNYEKCFHIKGTLLRSGVLKVENCLVKCVTRPDLSGVPLTLKLRSNSKRKLNRYLMVFDVQCR